MAVETTRWGILYCPRTGIISGTRKRWEKIQKILDERGVQYDMVQSETADSVERLIKMMISNGYKTIVIVGGDSALNDAVNCLMMEEKSVREEIALGVIPNGVMNDFARFWDFDEDKPEQTVDWLVQHRIRTVDLGCIRYTNANGEKCHRYFLNCLNIGMTADIIYIVALRDALPSHGVQDETTHQQRRDRPQGDDGLHRLGAWLRTDTECRALQRDARRVGGVPSRGGAVDRGALAVGYRTVPEPPQRASLSHDGGTGGLCQEGDGGG